VKVSETQPLPSFFKFQFQKIELRCEIFRAALAYSGMFRETHEESRIRKKEQTSGLPRGRADPSYKTGPTRAAKSSAVIEPHQL
jgi:hypothetical protein